MPRTPPLNPASRLLAVIRAATAEPASQPVIETWRKVLHVESEDPSGLFLAYGKLLTLAAEAGERVTQLEGIDHELYLHGIKRISATLSGMNFQSSWGQYVPQFDEASLRTLEIAADQIKRVWNEVAIEQSVLDALRAEIEGLIAETLESDLEMDIRRVVIHKLEDLHRAILDYQLDGAQGLRRAMEGAIGAVVTHPELGAKAKRDGVAEKFLQLIVKLDVTSRAALNLIRLAAPIVQQFLPPGASDYLELGDFPTLPPDGSPPLG